MPHLIQRLARLQKRSGWRITLDDEQEEAVHYDTIIISLGQAGNPLRQYNLTRRGWSVALIERKELGGTCVNLRVPRMPRRFSGKRRGERWISGTKVEPPPFGRHTQRELLWPHK